MRVSVFENFKIQRWIGFCFFQNSESSGGWGDEKAVLGKHRPPLRPPGRQFCLAVQCDCGAMHEASMSAVNRKHNPTRSCGFARPGELSRSLSTPLGWRVTAFRLSISDPRPQSPLMPYGPPARPVCLRSSCAGVSPTCAATACDPTHFVGESPA